MKKMLILAVLVVALVALTANVAMAGGWWLAGNDTLTKNTGGYGVAAGTWVADAEGNIMFDDAPVLGVRASNTKTDLFGERNVMTDNNPHGNFASTTNYCKTCHAVHGADDQSYRLLKNGGAYTLDEGEGGDIAGNSGMGTSRANECMYCHGATTGVTPIRPYAVGVANTVRGEHTIGETTLPDGPAMIDRDPNDTGNQLGCYSCHSVHGADTLAASTWAAAILRLDPNGDGLSADDTGRAGFYEGRNSSNTAYSSLDTDRAEGANFCADCHVNNAAADEDGSDATRPDNGTGKSSHVYGGAADGTLEVYGVDTKVAASSPTSGAKTLVTRGCRGCHSASDANNRSTWSSSGAALSEWPHQTLSSKLLSNSYKGETGGDDVDVSGLANPNGAADRNLAKMDAVCIACHANVGITF